MNRYVLVVFFGLAVWPPLQAVPAQVGEAQWPAALVCEFSVSGQQYTKRFPSVGNPYDANVERIGDHFAFRAVPVSSNGRDLDYVSLYTYYPARQKLILLHTVQYKPAPHFQTDQVNTGVTRVYSPVFERELIYSCHSEAS